MGDILVKSLQIHESNRDPALTFLTDYANQDQDYQKVIDVLRNGKALKNLPNDHVALNYKSIWESMSFNDTYGLLTYHDRIIVPIAARPRILSTLHLQHSGVEKTLRNARQLYFWPNMKRDVIALVSSCHECTKLLPSQPSEPLAQTHATRPFEYVSVDLGKQDGTEHLILADRYTGWPMVKPLRKLDTKAIISILEDWFFDHGKPERIRSDGGPQFRDEFKTWCKENHIIHELSSAHHHESNGHAEVTVKEMKHLLEKTNNFTDFKKALLEYRNTPRFDGLSPSQWLFGRRQRTQIAALPSAYQRITDSQLATHESCRKEKMDKQKSYADLSSKTLPPLDVGTHVIVQDPISKRWNSSAVITHRRNARSYTIRSPNGKFYLRNRKFLRPKTETSTYSPTPPKPSLSSPILKSEHCNSNPDPLRRSQRQRKVTFRYGT